MTNNDSKNKIRQTIALFGGTFDPIHLGHIKTVAALQQELNIDQIRWVLSAQPPHRESPQASIDQRLEMLNIALEGFSGMLSDDIEARRDKASFTIDTLMHFRREHPQTSINLIVGSDIMTSFHLWHRYDEILDVANVIVMHRAGYSNEINPAIQAFVTEDWSELRKSAFGHVFVYAAPPVPISATQIRQSIANANDVSNLLNPDVYEFIQQNHLYASTKTNDMQTETREDIMIESPTQTDLSAEPVLFNSEQQVEMIVAALEDTKALDITVLNVVDIATFTDYMIVATGTSGTHLQAISGNAIRELSRKGLKIIGEEGRGSSEWVLADFGDVVVHIMRQEVRELYDLEKLWDPDVRKALAEGHLNTK